MHALLLALAPFAFACSSAPAQDGGATAEEVQEAEPADGAGDAEADGEEEAPKWDVEHPPGPTAEVPIETTEGTWMSVDVSPEGDEIVFDLLGDLYVIPIGGGRALSLTHGMAWDMQPRYSPDGDWIAFTSDRAGGDNIWLVRRDGSDAKQVTDEDFRLPNSPTWTPDGEFLAVRKHFTKFRSLGTGEIWLYHRSGGKGLAMTEKPNDQKDVGEPAFSPDGEYLYYSRDATPGATFEYNKSPYGQIYVIDRLDRETGRIERVVGGPGGAVRPTPSPDGRWLAFVQRVRLETWLYLYDLESGEQRPLWGGLDRDMQETWAVHGVYPSMAWTPDSGSIVLWAQGGIWRVDATSGEATRIPFQVRDERTVSEALHFPIEVAPETFDVRMLRWAEPSPDGSRVVFGALGQLWIRDLPEGEARRLTSDEGHFEYYPSWSRDGSQVVFVSWDDEELGAVRVVDARAGSASRVVTGEPGHYVQPCFDPDGERIVFTKVGGEGLTSELWSHDPGLWWIPAGGGEATRVVRSGVRPHFGARSDRVFYMDFEDEDQRVLKSVALDGTEERTWLRSDAATEFRVSPDDRWVGFVERYRAYAAPFPPTGREVHVGPKEESLPLARLSKDEADYLRWSGDASKVHWTAGSELFTREMRHAFRFVEGAPDELPEPPEHGLPIGFEQPADVPSGAVALRGARLVTMRGDEVIEDGTVVVERNRIVAVGPSAEVEIPAGARVVDAAGTTVIPGIVDVHAHGPQGENGMQPEQNWLHYATLAFGVTTVHDPSNDTQDVFTSSEMARAGLITAPRIYSTGTILYGAAGTYKAEIGGLEDARFHVGRLQHVGAFSVKSYNQPRREQRQQVIAAARELGMEVVPEGGSLFHHNMTMVVDGHTGIEHAIPVGAVYDDVVDLWSGTRVGYTPTLGVAYGGLMGELYWYDRTRVFANERLLTFVPRENIDPQALRRTHAEDDDWNHMRAARIAKRLHDAGVGVQIGAHGQREGLAAHWEIWMLVQGGMTPHEALRAATLGGARYIGADADLGSIEVGKLADLAVLEGNPLEDVRTSEHVRYTMVNGRLFDAATMDEIGNHPRRRAPFWWERSLGR